MHRGKADLLQKGQSLRKIRFRLPGEARDQVRRQGAAGEGRPEGRRALAEAGGVVLPAHGRQSAVTAGLQGEVELGADVAALAQTAAKVLRHHRGLQGAQAHAGIRRGQGDGADRVRQAAAVPEVLAVGADLDAADHDLQKALPLEPGRLRRGLLQRHTADPAPGVGDHAVGAEVVAAVLDLHIGPGAPLHGPGGQGFQRRPAEGVVHGAGAPVLRHGPLHRLHEGRPVPAAEDHAGPQGLRVLRAELAVAAADRGHGPGVLRQQPPEGLAGFAPALGGDGAGVDDHRVGVPRPGGCVSVGGQQGLHGLGLELVDLAAQRLDRVFHFPLVLFHLFS